MTPAIPAHKAIVPYGQNAPYHNYSAYRKVLIAELYALNINAVKRKNLELQRELIGLSTEQMRVGQLSMEKRLLGLLLELVEAKERVENPMPMFGAMFGGSLLDAVAMTKMGAEETIRQITTLMQKMFQLKEKQRAKLSPQAREAYRGAVKSLHPDLAGGNADVALLQDLVVAREIEDEVGVRAMASMAPGASEKDSYALVEYLRRLEWQAAAITAQLDLCTETSLAAAETQKAEALERLINRGGTRGALAAIFQTKIQDPEVLREIDQVLDDVMATPLAQP